MWSDFIPLLAIAAFAFLLLLWFMGNPPPGGGRA